SVANCLTTHIARHRNLRVLAALLEITVRARASFVARVRPCTGSVRRRAFVGAEFRVRVGRHTRHQAAPNDEDLCQRPAPTKKTPTHERCVGWRRRMRKLTADIRRVMLLAAFLGSGLNAPDLSRM